MRRDGSRSLYYVRRVPADLRGHVVGLTLGLPIGDEVVRLGLSAASQSVRVSLRCSDPAEVKARSKALDTHLDAVWASLRAHQPIPLAHRQATALAGEAYRAWADEGRGSRTIAIELTADRRWVPATTNAAEEEALWDAAACEIATALDDDFVPALERKFGPIVDRLLHDKGIAATDPHSREAILVEVGRALRDAFLKRRRNAAGDYTPDATSSRFPQWEPSPQAAKSAASTDHKTSLSLQGLVEEWWAEARPAGRSISTYESYRNSARKLVAFLGHDDASRLSTGDIIAFKDARIAAGVSPKTVKDSDLSGLKSVLKRAVENGRLPANPATAVSVMRSRSPRVRSKSFTAEEAVRILQHATHYRPPPKESAKVSAAKRWVPWVCAYTGARVGEIAQLRYRDVRRESGEWIMTITPEAGTVKDKQPRDVVLHPHLLDIGFLDFVKASGEGHLFLRGTEGADLRGSWRSIKNRLVTFVREVVPDPHVAPNHGWRHLFKTIGLTAKVDSRLLDAIQGHAPSTEGGKYGDNSVEAQAGAMRQFPRFNTAAG